jgi:hypothetical protein
MNGDHEFSLVEAEFFKNKVAKAQIPQSFLCDKDKELLQLHFWLPMVPQAGNPFMGIAYYKCPKCGATYIIGMRPKGLIETG